MASCAVTLLVCIPSHQHQFRTYQRRLPPAAYHPSAITLVYCFSGNRISVAWNVHHIGRLDLSCEHVSSMFVDLFVLIRRKGAGSSMELEMTPGFSMEYLKIESGQKDHTYPQAYPLVSRWSTCLRLC